jgi:hypothetical protein
MFHRIDCVSSDASLFTLVGVRSFEGRSDSVAEVVGGIKKPSSHEGLLDSIEIDHIAGRGGGRAAPSAGSTETGMGFTGS